MRCAVLGSPIAHSLSPAMHRAAYGKLGLDWTYDAIELAEGDLELFLKSLGDDVRGLSVTAPLKRRVVELVEMVDDPILRVANTVIVDDGNLQAHNTDVPGAVAALHERGIQSVSTARILGGGATASSIAYALSTIGARHLEIVVRDPSRAGQAVDVAESCGLSVAVHTIDEPLLDKVDLLVSTVPGDVIGSRSHELVEASRAVFDVVYDPWPTPLMHAADEDGLPSVTGLDLLAHQAALQVVLMTGDAVSPQLLRDAALGELDARLPSVTIAIAALVAALVGAAGPLVLRRIPEPTEPDAGKTPYAVLAGARGLTAGLAIVAAAMAAIVAWRIDHTELLPVWVLIAGVGSWLMFIDWRTRLLPVAIVAPTYVVALALVGLSAAMLGDAQVFVHALVANIVIYVVFRVLYWVGGRFFGGAFGYGDVRLSGVLALGLGALGASQVFVGIYGGFVLGAVLGVVLSRLKIVDPKGYAFGPFMVVGAIIGAAWGASIYPS